MPRKQAVIDAADLPFVVVDKDTQRTPLKRLSPAGCRHTRAYVSNAYPTSGPTYVCADCGSKTSYPSDLDQQS